MFQDFWQRAKEAVEKVYDSTTFQDLVRECEARAEREDRQLLHLIRRASQEVAATPRTLHPAFGCLSTRGEGC